LAKASVNPPEAHEQVSPRATADIRLQPRGVLGDYFLKVSSLSEKPFRSAAFYIGLAIYASTAFGWLFAMRHLKLATISTVYSVSIILLLTTLGVVVFNERLSATEVLGILLALASLVLLVRFA
jgi:small multidrug resistance pump